MNESNRKMVRLDPAEMNALFGPPPVLSTEDPKRFEAVLAQLLACLEPRDMVELLLIRQYAHDSWIIERYSRHSTLAVERYHRQSREFLAEQMKEQETRREVQAGNRAERIDAPTDIARLVALEDSISESVRDVDDILERKATEMEHNHALERSCALLGGFDRLINGATARRNNALVLLDQYRAGLGCRVREATKEIIDAELAAEDQPTKEVIGAELAAEVEVTKDIIDANSVAEDQTTREIKNAELVAVSEADKEIGADVEQLTGAALAAEIARDQTRHISDRRWPNGFHT